MNDTEPSQSTMEESNKQQPTTRHRLNRQTENDGVPLVEFHDAISQSIVSTTDNDVNS